MNWQERAEKAEAELERLSKQEPVAYVKYKATGGNVGLSWLAVPTGEFYPREGEPLYAAPVPAVAAPVVPEDYRQALVEIALRCTDHDATDVIDALLQSATQSGSDPVAHHPV